MQRHKPEALLMIVIAIALVLTGSWAFQKVGEYMCHSAWKDSGMKSEKRFMSGCMIQLPNGTWIPSHNYRSM